MVEASEADVVGPTVAADNPYRNRNEGISQAEQSPRLWCEVPGQHLLELRNPQALGGNTRLIGDIRLLIEESTGQVGANPLTEARHEQPRLLTLDVRTEAHAQAELGVVFKE